MAKNYMHGLSTDAHNTMDVRGIFASVYDAICRHTGGLSLDVGCGGGRDLLAFHKLLKGNGRLVGIDADPKRISDALKNNGSNGNPLFLEATTHKDMDCAFSEGKIALINGKFPHKPFGNADIDLIGSADFILCNAVIMYWPPDKLEEGLEVLAAMMAPKGEMILRFSLDRPDKSKNPSHPAYDPSYHKHDPNKVMTVLARKLIVKRNADIPDFPVSGRHFSWVDLHAFKPG